MKTSRRHLLPWCALPIIAQLAAVEEPAAIIRNAFETADPGWILFVPPESKPLGGSLHYSSAAAHSGARGAELAAEQPARVGLRPPGGPIPVVAGERYRLCVWVKGAADFAPEPGTPGVIVRATLFRRPGVDLAAGHAYVGFKGVARARCDALGESGTLPSWTPLEAVIEIPPEATALIPFVFLWRARGSLYVDDFTLERVDADVPLTPILP